LPID